jgi:type IV pilus assembly protein PilY1
MQRATEAFVLKHNDMRPMNVLAKRCSSAFSSAVVAGFVALAGAMPASAAPLDISPIPLFLQESVPPLNMLVLGRDHKLYYEAYNDASDLNGDGVLDIRYKPDEIDYFGYFDSYKCYDYENGVFEPKSVTTNKKCSNQWSGDFLNYLTTARIDALRKVLYGGYRSTDTGDTTILERTHVPQDAHSWGKEYNGLSDGYDIREYSPLSLPASGRRHLFANTTPRTANGYDEPPLLRYLTDRTQRIWNWVSKEAPVAGTSIEGGGSVTPTDLIVRVRVCVEDVGLEANCRRYPNGNYKPIGLLQEFGENDSMYFGLLSGSYSKNTSGGVLRRAIGSIQNEIDADDGTFRDVSGILRTLNRLRVTGFGGNNTNYQYGCGWITTRPINEGECQMWGNPIAEMMYETLRYFAGRGSATPAFSITAGAGEEGNLPGGNLPVASWNNPYANRPVCSKPFQTVISDINPSYDSALPGNAFGESAPGDTLGDLNVSQLGDTIWAGEFGAGTEKQIFIGQSGNVADGAPTAKTVRSFGNIRGLAPEEPTKQGSYYSASVAYHGRRLNLRTLNNSAGNVNVNTFAVALASPLPRIEIPVGNGLITLVPFAKSVSGSGISPTANFQPTNQIVDFYVDNIAPDGSSGTFRVNFEDVEQGADHDMDAIATYTYRVNADNTVTIRVTSDYAAGSIIQHMGYIISGSTADGTYLVVRDVDTGENADVDFFLDTPPSFTGIPPAPNSGPGRWNDGVALPLESERTFTPGSNPAATFLKDPLWYAAKWGGFKDLNNNNVPDLPAEWDADNDGNPDNYFLVTNALTLGDQMRQAFQEIIARVASASSASVNSGSISSETRVYQARFNSSNWTGQLLAYRVNIQDGTLNNEPEWDAAQHIPAADARKIVTVNSDGAGVAFRWDNLDNDRKAQLDADEQRAQNLLEYLRGSDQHEQRRGGTFRNRESLLGDIVASAPIFVGRPSFSYPDTLESKSYSEFRANRSNRKPMVYVGANDGMVHAFDAENGDEEFAFIPSPALRNLKQLADPNYSHRFFVDGSPNSGDVYFGGNWETVLVGGLGAGGQGIYALKITNPNNLTEANAANVVLWEFTDEDDADLGYTFSQPQIVRLQNGRWAAVFGNGYNNTEADGSVSTTGNAVLYIVDIQNGKIIRKFDTKQGMAQDPRGAGRPNGMSTPAVVDLNGDYKVDFIYAGDLFGNMWKIDIRSTDPDDWKFAFGTAAAPQPLFTAVDPTDDSNPLHQPITSRPEIIRGPRGIGMMVLFGTGKYFEVNDKFVNTAVPEIQSYYGLWDRNTGTTTDQIASHTELVQQSIIDEPTITVNGQTVRLRTTTQHQLGDKKGWYLNLLSPDGYEGERQVSNTAVRAGRVIFTTLIPERDPCGYGGNSWLMELDARTGARLWQPPVDVNGDGRIDQDDLVDGVIPSGIMLPVGISPEPGILLSVSGDREYKYNPGTSGEIAVTLESRPDTTRGRQSWRQLR